MNKLQLVDRVCGGFAMDHGALLVRLYFVTSPSRHSWGAHKLHALAVLVLSV